MRPLHRLARALRRHAFVLPALAVLVILAPLSRPLTESSDAFYFWYAGRVVLTGGSPYDAAAWGGAAAFGEAARHVAAFCATPDLLWCLWLYPPWTASAFAPFALVDPPLGPFLLEVLVLGSAFVGSALAVTMFGPSRTVPRAAILAAVVASHPFVVDIRAGHAIGVLLIGLALVRRGLDGRAGSMVAGSLLLALKAHLSLVLAPLVFARLVRTRQWRVVGWTGAALGSLVALGLLLEPGSPRAILAGSSGKAGTAWSTTWAAAASSAAPLAVFVGLSAVALLAAVAAYRHARPERRDHTLVACGAALSIAATPYAQPYDLLLLVPLAALAAGSAEPLPATRRALALGSVIAALLLMPWEPLVFGHAVAGLPIGPGLLPAVLLAILAAVEILRARTAEAEGPAPP